MRFRKVSGLFLLTIVCSVAGAQTPMLDGVTFAKEGGTLYIPLREIAAELGLQVEWKENKVWLGGQPLKEKYPTLWDGTKLVPIRVLKERNATVHWDDVANEAIVDLNGRQVIIRKADKRAIISKKDQVLRGYQGDRLIIETRVSTGKKGHGTPVGSWKAGPEKSKMRYSRLYDNSPMPWAIQISGNIFMHGYHSVPKYPASHGCVRLPLRGKNAAKWIFEWFEVGSEVVISKEFPEELQASVSGK